MDHFWVNLFINFVKRLSGYFINYILKIYSKVPFRKKILLSNSLKA